MIIIRPVSHGFEITFRRGVPPLFVRSLSPWEGHPRANLARVLEDMWVCALP